MANSADPCSYARGSRLCIDVLGSPGEMFRDRFIDVDFRTSTIHNALFQCGSNAVVGTKPRYLRNREGTSGGAAWLLGRSVHTIARRPVDSDFTNSTPQFGLTRRLQLVRSCWEVAAVDTAEGLQSQALVHWCVRSVDSNWWRVRRPYSYSGLNPNRDQLGPG